MCVANFSHQKPTGHGLKKQKFREKPAFRCLRRNLLVHELTGGNYKNLAVRVEQKKLFSPQQVTKNHIN